MRAISRGVGPRRELRGQRAHLVSQFARLLDDEREAEAGQDSWDPVEAFDAPSHPHPPRFPVCLVDDRSRSRHPHPHPHCPLAALDPHRDRVRI
jgi:hypothetical protein